MTTVSNISDEHLIQQFVQGDLQAFDILYNRYVKSVYTRVRYGIPEMDVEDVTQNIFLAVIRSLPSFRGEAQFSTWLHRLTKNKIAEYYRKRSRKKETMLVGLEHAEKKVGKNNTKFVENNVLLQRALNNLHKDYREVILLRFVDDLRFNEIANHLNKNVEATKSLFRRAMSALRNELELEIENEQISEQQIYD